MLPLHHSAIPVESKWKSQIAVRPGVNTRLSAGWDSVCRRCLPRVGRLAGGLALAVTTSESLLCSVGFSPETSRTTQDFHGGVKWTRTIDLYDVNVAL